jgi:hypothetical protein
MDVADAAEDREHIRRRCRDGVSYRTSPFEKLGATLNSAVPRLRSETFCAGAAIRLETTLSWGRVGTPSK